MVLHKNLNQHTRASLSAVDATLMTAQTHTHTHTGKRNDWPLEVGLPGAWAGGPLVECPPPGCPAEEPLS